jgi:hypothetical protein
VAEDARAAARRIVEEVLAAHAAAAVGPEVATEAAAAEGDDTTDDHTSRADSADDHRSDDDGPHDRRAGSAPSGPRAPLDPRSDAEAPTSAVVADELDERPSRAVARRIVEEVLAAHAAAEREVELPAPAGEASGPPPPPEAVPVQPVPGRPAVVPGVAAASLAPAIEVETGPAAVADDAASIARRIVESVLAEAEARRSEERTPDGLTAERCAPEGATESLDALPDLATSGPVDAGDDADLRLWPDDGPPPHPVGSVAVEDAAGTLTLPVGDAAGPASEVTEAIPAAADVADEDPEATVALPVSPGTDADEVHTEDHGDAGGADPAVDTGGTEQITDGADDTEVDTDGTEEVTAAEGSERAGVAPGVAPGVAADETAALPAVDAGDDGAAGHEGGVDAEDEPSSSAADDPAADDPAAATEALPVDRGPGPGTDAEASTASSPAPADQRTGAGVATLPPRVAASVEATTPLPVTASAAKRTHWLIASILGAIGLAVLLPLAVQALRSLVALS